MPYNYFAVVWKDQNSTSTGFSQTPGAFFCGGIKTDLADGQLQVLSDGVYQIHSHASVHKMTSGGKFQHEIMRKRFNWARKGTVAEETLNRNCDPTVAKDETCFSSSLLATEHLYEKDIVSVHFQVNGERADPKMVKDFLVADGRSTYFGIVKLGVVHP